MSVHLRDLGKLMTADRIGVATPRPAQLRRGPDGGTLRPRRPDPAPVATEGVQWVCVRVWSGKEFAVADALEWAGFRVFAPHGVRVDLRARLGPSRRGRRERDYPVFGSYLFVGEPPGQIVARASHSHIIHVLECAGGRHVPAQFISGCADLWAAGKWDARGKGKFSLGAMVTATDGPFKGIATMIESLPSETRAVIRFALFGRQVRATVDVSLLELV